MGNLIGFDLETAKAGELFQYGEDFIRLGATIDDDEVTFFTDAKELVQVLNEAPWIYGHNILGFDLLALCFYFGADWEALSAKALDTLILSRLHYPPEARDTGGSVDRYDLDHCAERLGVPGKTDNLRELAKKYGGYDNISVDNEEYRSYLEGDVRSTQAVFGKLPRTPYAQREHKLASLAGRMTLNGFRVDLPLLAKRIDEGEERKEEALCILADDYGLPRGRFGWSGRGKDKVEVWEPFASPIATLEGRKWLLDVYDAYGVTAPPITDKGRLATSADKLAVLADDEWSHPDLRRILSLMSIVTTTRTVYQTVADHLVEDRVHPLINMGQASGRWSVTSPGLTVFGKRGQRFHERDIFLPEEDEVLLSCDMSQVDMRAVAGHCQDTAYMALFEPGKDIHSEIAAQVFGDKKYRQEAKAIGHGYNYGLGKNKLIAEGFNPNLVGTFFEQMETRYPGLMKWRQEVRAIGKKGELLDNGFGRKMRCDKARAYTQAPALMGQGGARDIVGEGLLRLPDECRPMVRLMVHDEIVLSVPKADVEEVGHEVKKAFTFEWRGVPILSELSKPGNSWGEVSEK
jgi:DNA polymerase I